ncbi:AI-2E family transporter [Clostridium grantii]|uniref:Predicted PurR-regulated permease PerM n=1 Tax=Clostridium grantii DSM 8605 TaxID=1121316 RepID=A0A1M5XPD7_9CLOT|nr:AI-2E family transporter [Clostridium grantii]SHI01671.1 Predicted PurR-regulated permease PerM [Clostridium grantii DSM 8605]
MEDNKFQDRFNYIFNKIIKAAIIFIFLLILILNKVLTKEIFLIFKPLLIAFAIAYLLDSAVRFFVNKFSLSRNLSITIVVLLILLIVILIGAIGIPALVTSSRELLKDMPENINVQFNLLNKSLAKIDNRYLIEINNYINESIVKILSTIASASSSILEMIVVNAFRITSSLFNVVVSFVIAIYMLIDKNDLKARIKRIVYAFFNEDRADYIVKIGNLSNEIFSSFFIGKLIDSFIIGMLCWVMLMFMNVAYSPIIAFIIGVTNMIPYFGPMIGVVPATLIVLLQSPILAVWVLISIIILQQFDGLVLGPYILGDSIGVGAFWIIVGVTVGGIMFGLVGMLIGVPLLVLLKNIIEEMVATYLDKKGLLEMEVENLRIPDINKESFLKKIRTPRKKKNK